MHLGYKGELIAKSYLVQKKGYRHVESNFKMRYGEIDLVMKDENQTVFVEVKTRHQYNSSTINYGLPWVKIERIQKAIDYYCQIHDIEDWRVELVAIDILPNARAKIEVMPI